MKKRKKRKKLLRLFIILIMTTFVVIGGICIYKNVNNDDSILSIFKSDYSSDALEIAKSYNIDGKLEDYEYSKTLEEALINTTYIDDYFEEYLNITYQSDVEDFLIKVNSYLEIGYNANEINQIFTLSSLNQGKLLELEYTSFSDYIEITNYNADNTDRYVKYLNQNDTDVQTAITYVNINLDLDFYEVVTEVDDPSSLDVLVNKYNSLPSDYVPENLTSIDGYEDYKLVDFAAIAIYELFEDAAEAGYNFSPFSAYRSYDYQDYLFSYYISVDGYEEAASYSAMPGHSEHQLGLAVDIYDYDYYYYNGVRVSDDEYTWILENAYLYGYILRYPNDSSDITGYIEEPWHLRYLGVELATSVYESGLTYDEYYDLYLTVY